MISPSFTDRYSFLTGVPDSLLSPLCRYIYARKEGRHIVAANEGNAVGLAAGYHLATGGVPLVYLQNSGIGNIVNPVTSLLNEEVYGIPVLFVVGWRGEPLTKDEPQHIYQGKTTLEMLDVLGIEYFIVGKDTSDKDVSSILDKWEKELFPKGRQAALVFSKGSIKDECTLPYDNPLSSCPLGREEAIASILGHSKPTDIFVSTTGKISRELFFLREERGEDHSRDFLTVGSMGHSSSIALSIALEKKERRVFILDGDGAVLMHMGSLATIGSLSPGNLVHIILDNAAHESVGGMPTVSPSVDFALLGKAVGYDNIHSAQSREELDSVLSNLEGSHPKGATLIHLRCAPHSRKDLGRPTSTPGQNKVSFMNNLLGK